MSAEIFDKRVRRLVSIRTLLRETDGTERIRMGLDEKARVRGEVTVAGREQAARLKNELDDRGLNLDFRSPHRESVSVPDGVEQTEEVTVRFAEVEAESRLEFSP